MAENKTMFDRIKELTAGLDEQVSELFQQDRLPDFLWTMSHLTGYSLNNILLIHKQRPYSTMLQSYEKWQEQGRYVDKGQKGIQILTPASYTVQVSRDRVDPRTHAPVLDGSGNPVKETVSQERTTFRVSTVFDVSQTHGDRYPEIQAASMERMEIFLEAAQRSAKEPIVVPQSIRGIDAVIYMISELAKQRESSKDHSFETALAANTVCKRYQLTRAPGVDLDVVAWSAGKSASELRASLETVRRTAHSIIRDLDRNYLDICQERGMTPRPEYGGEWSRSLMNFMALDGSYKTLIDPGADGFAIFQLRQDPALARIMFMDSDWMAQNGQQIRLQNYECKYVGMLPEDGSTAEKLEKIFAAFNENRPQDFHGHSLSVSDVVAIYEAGALSCHYVDKIGFKELPGFLPEQAQEKTVPVQDAPASEKGSLISQLDSFRSEAASKESGARKIDREAR